MNWWNFLDLHMRRERELMHETVKHWGVCVCVRMHVNGVLFI